MDNGVQRPTRTLSFEEEVQLSDGRVITVNRSIIQRQYCEGITCSWGRLRDRIAWRTDDGKILSWDEHLNAMLLDRIEENRWVIVGYAGFPTDKIRYDAERNPYVVFNVTEDGSVQTPFTESLVGRHANMLIVIDHDKGEQEKVTIKAKEKRDSHRGLPESRRRIAPDLYIRGQ